MIIFENPGEIDVAAISTFGVSVKESDNPIGFFGTGLKYALAILLRTGHRVTAWSGMTRLEFGTEATSIRGKDFEIVTMNGERLGFTTEVGKTWELWMAYRELFCNARDEGGNAFIERSEPEPREGCTRIAVSGTDFEAVHQNRWQFFIEDEPDYEVDGLQVWNRPSTHFFYRGVRVAPLPRMSMRTYNDTHAMELTEDRTAKDTYGVPWRIARALLNLEDGAELRRILTAPKDRLEHHLDFHGWSVKPSDEFLRTVGQLTNEGIADINVTARKLWEEKQPKEFAPRELVLTAAQMMALERAMEFCGKIGFPIRESYPVKVVESLGTDTLGLAKDGVIYIAARAFDVGTKSIAGTLIEEYVHLRFKHLDCTRDMQNWLLDRMVGLGEELVGEPV